jgi:hypothetical protein
MSRKTVLVVSRKVLNPPSTMAFRRSSIGMRFYFCTMRTLCNSRGISSPLKNFTA